MPSFFLFLFRSGLISALLFAYYLLALKDRKLHSYNRAYLLAIVPVSLLLPVLHLHWYGIAALPRSAGIRLLQAITATGSDEALHGAAGTTIAWQPAACAAYVLAALVLLGATLHRIAGIYKLRTLPAMNRIGGVTIVQTDDSKAPFSFFNTIFWRSDIAIDSVEGRQILQHELAHVAQCHTVDKLLVQLAIICCWANPVYWLLQKELALVHEYIADEAAIQDNDTASFAMMLLQARYGGITPYIVNPFFHSAVKRRLFMLSKTNQPKYSLGRMLMALPLLGTAVLLFSFATTKSSVPGKATQKLLVVLDAAHGGTDAGATAADGTMEKDLNLAICSRIAALAGEYNIETIPTRREDAALAFDERVAKANAAKGALLISIHVNKASPDNPVAQGYEVIVSDKNREAAKSRLLASAVIGGMQQPGVKPVFISKGIWVLKNSNTPAIAIECGDMDNAAQMALLHDDERLSALCRGILSGVVAYEHAAH